MSIAYGVVGEGRFDRVFVAGWILSVFLSAWDLVAGSGIDFRERGSAQLKGVPGEWQLFAVSGIAA